MISQCAQEFAGLRFADFACRPLCTVLMEFEVLSTISDKMQACCSIFRVFFICVYTIIFGFCTLCRCTDMPDPSLTGCKQVFWSPRWHQVLPPGKKVELHAFDIASICSLNMWYVLKYLEVFLSLGFSTPVDGCLVTITGIFNLAACLLWLSCASYLSLLKYIFTGHLCCVTSPSLNCTF